MQNENKNNFLDSLKCFGSKVKGSLTTLGDSSNALPSLMNINESKSKNIFSFNDELLLDSMLFKKVKDFAANSKDAQKHDKANIINELRTTLSEYERIFFELTEHFNKVVRGLKRLEVKPSGFHIIKDASLNQMEESFINKSNQPLPMVLLEKITVKTIKKEDVIQCTEPGKKKDWLNFMIPDGKVFSYTVLTENELSRTGFPIGLYTKEGQDVDVKSIKNIYYMDPITGKTKKGIYFEVYESAGPLGNGGVNGVVAPADKALVIINHSKNEAYFLNLNKKDQSVGIPSMGVGMG